MGDQFHFHPEAYLELLRSEVPAYDRLQDVVAQVTSALGARSILDLGVGTGVTSQRVLAEHPTARLVGVDESSAMLEHARRALPTADLRAVRLEDPLPQGPFDLVVSALTVHHLDGPGKADLFRRVASVVVPGGRVVVGDVVVPEDPADAVTPIDEEYDKPSWAVSSCIGCRNQAFGSTSLGSRPTWRRSSATSAPSKRAVASLPSRKAAPTCAITRTPNVVSDRAGRSADRPSALGSLR